MSGTLAEYVGFTEDPGEFRVSMLDNHGLAEAHGLLLPVIFTFAEFREFMHREGFKDFPGAEDAIRSSWRSFPRVEIVPE